MNESAATSLRRLQKDHALILLNKTEMAALLTQGTLAMPERHREHFVKVMRRAGVWQALASDGEGSLAAVTVENSLLKFNATSETKLHPPRAPMTLVQAWIKPKALKVVLQKSAEFGVSEIHLIDCERAQVAQEKAARIEAIVENACMQAYNVFKPQISVTNLTDWLSVAKAAMVFGDLEARNRLTDFHPENSAHRGFINGPEGGFTAAEIEALREKAGGVLLSENVLRSETAAIFALGYLCLVP